VKIGKLLITRVFLAWLHRSRQIETKSAMVHDLVILDWSWYIARLPILKTKEKQKLYNGNQMNKRESLKRLNKQNIVIRSSASNWRCKSTTSHCLLWFFLVVNKIGSGDIFR
jgi:hypothetical protein